MNGFFYSAYVKNVFQLIYRRNFIPVTDDVAALTKL